jgi:phosphoribosylformylglycinamidine cyclo-ligase
MLPGRCKAVIDLDSWTPQPIFSYLQKAGNVPEREMMRTFNNGLGLVIVVSEKETDEVLQRLEAIGEKAYLIGTVEAREEKEDSVQFLNFQG